MQISKLWIFVLALFSMGAVQGQKGYNELEKQEISILFGTWTSTNYKGKLIEYCHSKEIDNPIFLIKDITGPDHYKTFEIQVKIGSQVFASGLGTNKKTAEQIAAQMALEEMGAPI